MCEIFSSSINRFPDMSKIALKGQFYVIMIGVEVEIKKFIRTTTYYSPGELVAI